MCPGYGFNHHRLNYYFVYIFKTRTDNKDKVKSFKKITTKACFN